MFLKQPKHVVSLHLREKASVHISIYPCLLQGSQGQVCVLFCFVLFSSYTFFYSFFFFLILLSALFPSIQKTFQSTVYRVKYGCLPFTTFSCFHHVLGETHLHQHMISPMWSTPVSYVQRTEEERIINSTRGGQESGNMSERRCSLKRGWAKVCKEDEERWQR